MAPAKVPMIGSSFGKSRHVLLAVECNACTLDFGLVLLCGHSRLLRLQVDSDAINPSGELKRHLVFQTDGSSSVLPDIESLHAHGEAHGDCVLDSSTRHFRAIDGNRAQAAFANTAAVVFEIEIHRVGTRC